MDLENILEMVAIQKGPNREDPANIVEPMYPLWNVPPQDFLNVREKLLSRT